MSRRARSILIVGGILLGVVLCLVAAFFLRLRRTRAAFEAEVASLRARGEPTTFAELEPDPVPDRENAAVLLSEVRDAYDRTWPEKPTPRDVWFEWDQAVVAGEEPSPDLRAQLEAWRPQLEPLWDAIVEASQRERFVPELEGPNLVPSVPVITTVHGLLEVRNLLEPERAPEAAEALLRVANGWRPRSVVSFFVRGSLPALAISMLQRRAGDDTFDWVVALTRLDPLLAQAEATLLEDWTRAQAAARVVVIEAVRSIRNGDMGVLAEGRGAWHRRSGLYEEALDALRLHDRVQSSSDDDTKLRARLLGQPYEALVSSLFLGPYAFESRQTLGALARIRLARVGLRVCARRAAGEDLAKAVEAALHDVGPERMIDPLSGRPWHWRRYGPGVWISVDVEAAPPGLVSRAYFESDEIWRDLRLWSDGLAWAVGVPDAALPWNN